jgi:hypothetical protein
MTAEFEIVPMDLSVVSHPHETVLPFLGWYI